MDGVRHRLSQTEADFLAGLVSAKPDVDTPDRIKLDPKYSVIVDGVDLALQPDELILLHRGGTKIWKSAGVRTRILRGKSGGAAKMRPYRYHYSNKTKVWKTALLDRT